MHLRELFAADPARGRAARGRGRRPLPRLLEEPDHGRDARAARCSSPRSPAWPSGSRRCSAASGSTSPRTAPSSTSRCACPRATSLVVDGRRRRRRGARRCSTAWPPSPSASAPATWTRAHGQADPERRQHRHRRLRSRAGDGLRGAALLHAARPDVPVRLQRRLHRLRRGDPRPRPRRDALHRLLEDVHDARDDDQRPLGPRLDARRPRRRGGDRQALRRRLHQRRGASPSSGSTPPTCSASGTGSAGATRWTRRSASRRCSPIGPERFRELLAGFHAMDEHFRTTPFERNLPVLMGLLGGLVRRLLRRPDRRRACPTAST